jgi:uncharacterized protein (UPF0261 family)
MDTKAQEALFISTCLQQADTSVQILDAGIRGNSPVPVNTSRTEVAKAGGKTLSEVQSIGHEGEALEVMTRGAIACAQNLYRQKRIQGVIGLGGSMGTTLASGVMRSFPVGVPKVMISTMASRDTRAFVGTKDIMMLHSVCDLSGLNRFTRKILHCCNEATGPVKMLIPMDGFSAFDSKEGPLYDPDAPQLFAKKLQAHLNDQMTVSLLPYHINDPEFAVAILEAIDQLQSAQ